MTKEELQKIRSWLVENVFRDPDIMLSDCRCIDTYGDPGERREVDLCEIIASLYEVLHREVEGEEYEYFFHHANKTTGESHLDSNMFVRLLKGGDPFEHS